MKTYRGLRELEWEMQRESKVLYSKNKDSFLSVCKQACMLGVVRSMHKCLPWCVVCVVKLIQNKFYLVKLYEEDDICSNPETQQ